MGAPVFLAGPALFVVTALVLGLVKPHYRPLHNTISELALDRYGYLQTANFVINGSLVTMLGLVLATRHQHLYGSIAIMVMGLVLISSGIFRTDPIATGTSTSHGKVHNALFFVGIFGTISGQLVTGFGNLGSTLGVFSLTCGVLTLALLPITVTRQRYMGLFQRLVVVVVVVWMTGFGVA